MNISLIVKPHGKVDQYGYTYITVTAAHFLGGTIHTEEDYFSYHTSDDLSVINSKLKDVKISVLSKLIISLVNSETI